MNKDRFYTDNDFLNSSDNDDKIYDKFILYLMGIKDERGWC